MPLLFGLVLVCNVVLLVVVIYLGVQAMTAKEQIQAALARQGAAIGNIAADIRELKDKLPAEGGLNAEDTAAFVQELEAKATALEAVASEYQSVGETPDPPVEEGEVSGRKRGSGLSNS